MSLFVPFVTKVFVIIGTKCANTFTRLCETFFLAMIYIKMIEIMEEMGNKVELSTKARYGSRFMLELAIHYGEGPISLKDIAQRQEISEKYLWNVMGPLKTIGLVRATRGSFGGFVLAKAPSEINMRQIVSALEGSLCLVQCVEDSSVCDRVPICVTRDIWGRLSDILLRELESITLEDMVESSLEKERMLISEYCI